MITVVTAYVPIPNHPRSMTEYHELGQKLLDLDVPVMFQQETLDSCWLFNYLQWRGGKFTHSVADNPQKNSVAYHIVQAQKSEFLLGAAENNPQPDVFVWIDFGIFHLPGVTGTVIKEFLQRAESEQAIAIPGCWDPDFKYEDSHPCWRFCGGLMVVPRKFVMALDIAMKYEYMRWLAHTNNLSWEVNTLARLERLEKHLPLWWYKADHDAQMFTGYKVSEMPH